MYFGAFVKPFAPDIVDVKGIVTISNALVVKGYDGRVVLNIRGQEFPLFNVEADKKDYQLAMTIKECGPIKFMVKGGDAHVKLYGHIADSNCLFTCNSNCNIAYKMDHFYEYQKTI